MVFCLVVHWLGLKTWFYLDDFAWLGLPLHIHSFRDLFPVLFGPQAQGTVRTLSERLFFLTLTSLFGINIVPFKICVYLTQFANIVLLMQIARRLSGSALAGFLAGVLWVANPGLAIALAWTSAYNEIAFCFCLLLAFRLLLAHIQTGKTRYWVWQWVVFILGFGALELMVVYPAIAAAYTWLRARSYFRKTLYLFIPSLIFTFIHFVVIGPIDAPAYRMFFGSNLWHDFWKYLLFALGASRPSALDWRPVWLGSSLGIAILLLLLLFAFRKALRREYVPLFALAWFVIVIVPVLPLKNHFTDYYVTVPSIGLAILGGWAIASAPKAILPIATLVALLYVVIGVTDIHVTQDFYQARAKKINHLFAAVMKTHSAQPDKTILVDGIDSDTYWLAFDAEPFRLIRLNKIYLVPGSEKAIQSYPEIAGLSRYTKPFDEIAPLAHANQVDVLAMRDDRVVDVTSTYWKHAAAEYCRLHPQHYIDVADPWFESLLGPEWYSIERDYRWMPQRATLRIAGPSTGAATLKLTGHCPEQLISHPGARVTFRADGIEIGSEPLVPLAGKQFTWQHTLPHELIGRPEITLSIETNYVLHVADDPRPLSLVFGAFSVE